MGYGVANRLGKSFSCEGLGGKCGVWDFWDFFFLEVGRKGSKNLLTQSKEFCTRLSGKVGILIESGTRSLLYTYFN